MTPTRLALWTLLPALACSPKEGREDPSNATFAPPTTTADASTGTTQAPTTGEPTSTAAATTAELTATLGDSEGGTSTAAALTTGDPPKFDLPIEEPPPPEPIPVKEIPGLMSITFYESTSGIAEFTFTVDGPELNTLLADPLDMVNRDIQGTSVEFYDVYYSDVDGVFDANGSYLTIAGSFGAAMPAGGGLNLAEISLNYADNQVEYGSFLASFVGLGDNYIAGSEVNAIDGDLNTHTTMGNTLDSPGQRLRVTLGFESSLMPPG